MKYSHSRQLEVARKLGFLLPEGTGSWLKVLCVVTALTLVVKECITSSLPEEVYRHPSTQTIHDYARFNAYWRKQFNTTDVVDGHNTVLKRFGHDVTNMSDGAVQRPFITGSPPSNAVITRIRRSLVYNNPEFARSSGCEFVPTTTMDNYRNRNQARIPNGCSRNGSVPWLLELRNVWMTANGDIFTLDSHSTLGVGVADMFAFGGGLLQHEWSKPLARARAKIPLAMLDTQCRHKLAFAMAKYHGSTYFHVMTQQITRLLTFWETAVSVFRMGGVIVGPKSGVIGTTLRTFGIPPSGYRPISSTKACFFDHLIVPEPFDEGRYNHKCIRRATDDIVRYVFSGSDRLPALSADISERRKVVEKRGTPVVVLIERATFRLGPLCFHQRCMANFHALKDAICREFGDKISLKILSPNNPDVMRQGVRLFREADVVVGVHGAAFHNVAHMRGYGTYALHLGWNTPGFYAEWARKHHVEHVNIVTPGCSHGGINVHADIRIVISEIRRALQREGFTLDPSNLAVPRNQYQHLLITTSSAVQ